MIPQNIKILVDPEPYGGHRAFAYIVVFRHKRFKKKEKITEFEVVHSGKGTFGKKKGLSIDDLGEARL